jgi:hypothetical protein
VITLDRIVSLEDYADFAQDFAGVDKAQASIVVHGESLGVLLTLAGVDGSLLGPTTRDALLSAIANIADRHVPVTLRDYRPQRFTFHARLAVADDREPTAVLEQVEAMLLARFGFAERRLGEPVAASEIVAAVHSVTGVVMVDIDELQREDLQVYPDYPELLPCAAPTPYADVGSALGAELLHLDSGGLELEAIA